MSGLKQQALKGSLWVIGSKAIDIILRTILTAILARFIAPEAYGTAQLATAFLNFIETIALLGVGPAIIRFQSLDRKTLSTAFWFTTITAVFYCGIIFVSAGLVSSFFKNQDLNAVLQLYSLLPLFVGISVIGESLLVKKLDFKTQTHIELGCFVFVYIPVVSILAYLGYGLWALVLSNFASTIARSLLYFWKSKLRPLLYFNFTTIKPLLKYGFGVSNARLFNVVANQTDNLVVGRFFGATNLGFYSKAFNLMSLLIRTTGMVTDKVLFSAFSKKQDNEGIVLQNLQRTSILVNFYAFPFSFLAIFLAEEIILLLYGPNWLASIAPFKILAVVIPIRLSYKLPITVMQALGKSKLVAQISFQYAVLVVILCSLGAYFVGFVGVPFGIVIATIIQFTIIHIRLSFLIESYNFTKLWETFIPALKITAVIGIPTLITFGFLYSFPWAKLIAVFVGIVVFFLFLVFNKRQILPDEFFWVLKEFKGITKKKLPK